MDHLLVSSNDEKYTWWVLLTTLIKFYERLTRSGR